MSVQEIADQISCPREDVEAVQNLVREMVTKFGRVRVVEVGTWMGKTALKMLEAGAAEVHCVDHWEGTDDPEDKCRTPALLMGHSELYKAFRESVGDKLHNGIEPHVGTSLHWAKSWPWQAELIFIDADHREAAVRADIAAWAPYVRPGGILCGHDYSGSWMGVIHAVDDTGGCEKHGGSVWVRRM